MSASGPAGSGARLRVLHVIESMAQGGAETLVVEHARHASPDVETLVVALNRGGPALDAAAAAGARVFMLGKGARRLTAFRRLARLITREQVSVVNAHNAVGALYGTVAACWARVPVVVRTEHSIHYRGRHSWLYQLLEPLLTRRTARVVCVSQRVLESHVARLPWAHERFAVVLNGVSPAPARRSRDDVRMELGLTPEEPLVLAVGSLTPQKDQRTLLAAFDVAIVPFLVNELTHAVSPIKLFEYLAGGKPVVSTPLKECARLPFVRVAGEPAEFVRAIEWSLGQGQSPEHGMTRQ